jgi:hypothetical protein
MAFLATLASDYRKQPAVRIMPDHRKALVQGFQVAMVDFLNSLLITDFIESIRPPLSGIPLDLVNDNVLYHSHATTIPTCEIRASKNAERTFPRWSRNVAKGRIAPLQRPPRERPEFGRKPSFHCEPEAGFTALSSRLTANWLIEAVR